MGFTGIDDLINQITTNGKFIKQPFSRVVYTGATSVAGRWHEALSAAGTGGSMTLTGTAGTGVALNRSTTGALPLNADVSTATRHLLSMMGITASTTMAPALLMLTDLIHIYPSCVLTGTPSTLSNHPTWTGTGDTRMTNANGVQCSVIVTTAGSAGNGQLTPTYYDQDGNSTAAPGSLYAASTTHPAGCLYGQTSVAATIGGPFMPLAAGDRGVQRIASYVINTGLTSGVGAFVLHRPICTIPIVAANVAGERDFLNQIPALNRIYDDSCLGLLIQIGGAMTAGGTVVGEFQYGWGG